MAASHGRGPLFLRSNCFEHAILALELGGVAKDFVLGDGQANILGQVQELGAIYGPCQALEVPSPNLELYFVNTDILTHVWSCHA